MPVKKYFMNTFGEILNEAMYELQWKQYKYPEQEDLFTVEGGIKLIADFILQDLEEGKSDQVAERKNSGDSVN